LVSVLEGWAERNERRAEMEGGRKGRSKCTATHFPKW